MNINDYIKLLNNKILKENKISLKKNNTYKTKISKTNKYDNYINNGINIIKNNNTIEENQIINNNVNTLKVSNIPLLLKCFKRNYTSFYNPKKNKISLDENVMDSLNHELLHVASTKIIDNTIYSGLMIYDNNKEFGRGINEGFTEILTEEYFNKQDLSAYQLLETNICKYLIEIVGFKKIKKYYFTADVNSLINELKKYDTKDEIISFIKDIDNMNNNEIKNKMIKCYLRLYKWKVLKLKNDYKNGIIDKLKYEEEVLDNNRIYPTKLLVLTASTEPITSKMKEEVRSKIK